MTATAFAFDPALDPHQDPAMPPVGDSLPRLRVIDGGVRVRPGGASGADIEAVPAGSSVEVYRRRRFFALVLVTMIVLGVAWAAGISVTSFPPETTPATSSAQPRVHVVAPGDTYGSIAAELGAADHIAAAEQLRVANGGAELVVGQRLVVDSSELGAVRR